MDQKVNQTFTSHIISLVTQRVPSYVPRQSIELKTALKIKLQYRDTYSFTCTIYTMQTLVTNVQAAATRYSLDEIERALICTFVKRLSTKPRLGTVIDQSMQNPNQDLEKLLLKSHPETLTLNDLVMCFETLVPSDEAKQYGAVFTPTAITTFMANLAVNESKNRGADLQKVTIIDPAVGCGALLVAALIVLFEDTGVMPSEISNRLFGIDISPNSINRANLLLNLTCLSLGDPNPSLAHLSVDNALTTKVATKYDIVLANPPYVRYQQLSTKDRSDLAQKWKSCQEGNFNLYFPFFELAQSLTKENGVAVYITPNGFFTSKSATPLRKWFTETSWLNTVLDFGPNRVFEAMTYTTITLAGSPKRKGINYLEVKGLTDLAELESNWQKTRVENYQNLSSAPWRVVNKNQRQVVDIIANTGKKLGTVANVGYGLATLRDKLYTLNGTKDTNDNYVVSYENTVYTIEPQITKPVVKVAGLTQEGLAENKLRIIHPYTYDEKGRATIIPENILSKKFPNTYTYLKAIRSELSRRDKGNKTYTTWYAYGRTQGLSPIGTALLTPLYAGKPRFMHTLGSEEAFMLNGCVVKLTNEEYIDLKSLAVILNSGLVHFFIEATSNSITGGFYAYQKTPLSALGIPKLTKSQKERLCAVTEDWEKDEAVEQIYKVKIPSGYKRKRAL